MIGPAFLGKFFASRLFRPAMMGLAVLALVSAAWLGLKAYGNAKYKEGVRDTTQAFIKSDLEGAANVQDTAARVIRETHGLDGDVDVDGLLDETGGLRADP